MSRAITLAQAAGVAGEVPAGAVIVDASGNLIAEAENRREEDLSRRNSRSAGNWSSLAKLAPQPMHLYVTLEPPMCGAIQAAGLWFMVLMTQTGAIRTVNIPDSACSSPLSVLGGILESACRQQLQGWFTSTALSANLAS